MNDAQLIQHCLELAGVRQQMATLHDRDQALAGDIMAELRARKLDFVQFAPHRRAEMDQPVTREIEVERFAALCKQREIRLDDAAACITRRVKISAAHKLFGADDVASICTVTRGNPRLRLIDKDGEL